MDADTEAGSGGSGFRGPDSCRVCALLRADKPVQRREDAGQDKNDEQRGGNRAAGDHETDFPDGRICEDEAQYAGGGNHDQGRGENGVQGSVIRTADGVLRAGPKTMLAVIGRIEDGIVDRRSHEDTLHHQEGQVVHTGAAQPDDGHGQVNAALNRQHQDQGNDHGSEGQRDHEEYRGRRNQRNSVQLRVKGLRHLLIHDGGADQPGFSLQQA